MFTERDIEWRVTRDPYRREVTITAKVGRYSWQERMAYHGEREFQHEKARIASVLLRDVNGLAVAARQTEAIDYGDYRHPMMVHSVYDGWTVADHVRNGYGGRSTNLTTATESPESKYSAAELAEWDEYDQREDA